MSKLSRGHESDPQLKAFDRMDDQALFLGIQRRDSAALSELVARHSYTMLRLARAITGSPDSAQDIVQDVFIALWLRAETLDIVGNVRGYLWSATRNQARMLLRHESVIERHREGSIADLEIVEPFIDTIEQEETARRIYEALEELPRRCREIFLLHWRDDLSVPEIADALQIGLPTVRNQIGRAMRHLVGVLRQSS